MECHVITFIVLLTSSLFACNARQSSGYFWHVTDFHLDFNYSSKGNPNDMCWIQENHIGFADKIFGDYKCDSPYRLVESAMDAMKDLGANPDFILWTGDDKAHVKDSFFSREIVLDLIQNLTETLRNTFPDVPIVPVLGNHDWFPTHQLPAGEDTLYKAIAELWTPWLGEAERRTFIQGGYYSMKIPQAEITFLVLNTALYYEKNKQVSYNTSDPGNQFAWIEQQLKEIRQQGKKVFITSHVPVGVFERHFDAKGWTWLKAPFNKRYVDLISKNSDVISGQFFAHHHTDSFRIFYNDSGLPVSWLLVAPAVTPWNTTLSGVGPNNPGLRRYFYSQTTHQIDRFEQYYLNLSLANNERKDMWKKEYDTTEAYNLTEGVTPQALHALVQEFNQTDRTTFDRYYLYNSVSYQPASECNENCRQYHMCAITNVDFEAFRDCYKRTWSGEEKNRAISLHLSSAAWIVVVMVVVWTNLKY